MVMGAYAFVKFALTELTFKLIQKGQWGGMYGLGGIYFSKLYANRVYIEVDSVRPIGADDVWSNFGHILRANT